jgi:hypothetical protein
MAKVENPDVVALPQIDLAEFGMSALVVEIC